MQSCPARPPQRGAQRSGPWKGNPEYAIWRWQGQPVRVRTLSPQGRRADRHRLVSTGAGASRAFTVLLRRRPPGGGQVGNRWAGK